MTDRRVHRATADGSDNSVTPKIADSATAYREGGAAQSADAGTTSVSQEANSSTIDELLIGTRTAAPAVSKRKRLRAALGVVVLVPVLLLALFATAGYWAYDRHEKASAAANLNSQREAYLQAGRRAAINLTTIRLNSLDADVLRILDSTGDPFRADFASRADSFKAVVKEAKSTSTGSLTGAGIESFDGAQAKVLVTANVETSNVGQQNQEPRSWRMRVTVRKVQGAILATSVEFVA